MKEKQLCENELYEMRFGVKERRSNARFLFILALVLWALVSFRIWWTGNFGGVVVDGSSMYATLTHGEKLLMHYTDEKYRAERGDIVVVYVADYPEIIEYNKGKAETDQLKYLIKRLIAIEGDKVRCTDGVIEICYAGTEAYVALDEPYAYYGFNGAYKERYDFAEYEVGEGEVFFLGDNRSSSGSSVDSRYQEGSSHLDRLYKEEDIYGVVPDWAVENQKLLAFFFF